MKKTGSLVLALLMAIVFSACGSTYTDDTAPAGDPVSSEGDPATADTEGQPSNPGTKSFIYSQGADPVTLDFGKSVDNMSNEAIYMTQTVLMREISDVYEPDAAERLEVSEDGLTLTFHLREGLLWADGVQLTASDYRTTLLHALDPQSALANANIYYPIVGAEAYNLGTGSADDVGVSAPDDLTLTIQLDRLAPSLHNVLKTVSPIRQDLLDAHGQSYGSSVDTYLSSGPFLLTRWDYEQQLVYKKNPLFWNADQVNITDLTWMTVIDKNATLNLFETGQTHMISASDENLATFSGMAVDTLSQSAGNALQCNFGNPANPEAGRCLSNPNFRLALSYAIDREPLAQAINGSAYRADRRLVSEQAPTVSGRWADTYPYETAPVTAQPDQAKEYMDKALEELGYDSAAQLPEFTFLMFEVPTYRSYAEGIADAWNTVLGVDKINYSILPIPQAIEAGMSGSFDIYIQGVSRDSDPFLFLQMFASGGSIDWCDWDGKEEYTRMLYATNEILDEKERQDALFASEQYFTENGVLIPLWSYGNHYLIRPETGLTGYGKSVFKSGGPGTQLVYADVTPDSQR